VGQVEPHGEWGKLNQVQLALLIISLCSLQLSTLICAFKYVIFLIKFFCPIPKYKHTFNPRTMKMYVNRVIQIFYKCF